MKKARSSGVQDDLRLLALGAFLQAQLDIVVTTAQLFPVGQWWLPPPTLMNSLDDGEYDDDLMLEIPSSLITIDSFNAGGFRRLVLNVNSPLVHDMANTLRSGKTRLVRLMGEAMVRSGTWPLKDIDLRKVSVRWGASPGVIACPHFLSVTPVPHVEINKSVDNHAQENVSSSHKTLAVWPMRLWSVRQVRDRGDPGLKSTVIESEQPRQLDQGTASHPNAVLQITRAHERWEQRDIGLRMEFEALLRVDERADKCISFASWCRSLFDSSSPSNHTRLQTQHKQSWDHWKTGINSTVSSAALLTMAPSLPIYVVASHLLARKSVSPITALPRATSWLLRNDRMFAFSLFFGVPLMDRTGVLSQTVKVHSDYCQAPPETEECRIWYQNWKRDHSCISDDVHRHSDQPQQTAGNKYENTFCYDSLRHCMLQRATGLWSSSERTQKPSVIMVAWSGGIDSTAVLCALLESAMQDDRMQRLLVLLDDESVKENPTFYQRQIVDRGLHTVRRNGEPLSTHAVRLARGYYEGIDKKRHKVGAVNGNVLVTGELGDQLFGSAKLGVAFDPPVDKAEGLNRTIWTPDGTPRKLGDFSSLSSPDLPPDERVRAIFMQHGLAAPWENTILQSLECFGLLEAHDGASAWKRWIKPQLEKAPFPIISTFDFLWWVNFSMKWQNVSLRCLHDGGLALLAHSQECDTTKLTGCIQHFFDGRDFECWSCVPEFHGRKFPDLKTWSTYKEPLKHYILSFDGDEAYYLEKKKVGSLSFGAPEGPRSLTNQFYGAIAQRDDESNTSAEAYKVTALMWGECGMIPPTDYGLTKLLSPHAHSMLNRYPSESIEALITPVPKPDVPSKTPFDLAPYFIPDEIDYQRLSSSCNALLDPEIVEGRKILILNDESGAMCYWALCMGASQVVTLSTSISDYHRACECLKRVHSERMWAQSFLEYEEATYKVVLATEGVGHYLRSCDERSWEVVVFVGEALDDLSVASQISRVCYFAALFDLPHPDISLLGLIDDPDFREVGESPMSTSVAGGRACLKSSVKPPRDESSAEVLYQVVSTESEQDSVLLPTRLHMERMMTSYGWRVKRLFPERSLDNDGANTDFFYSRKPRHALPSRYLLQCVKPSSS